MAYKLDLVLSENLHSIRSAPLSINLLKFETQINLFIICRIWLFFISVFDKIIVALVLIMTMLTLLLW